MANADPMASPSTSGDPASFSLTPAPLQPTTSSSSSEPQQQRRRMCVHCEAKPAEFVCSTCLSAQIQPTAVYCSPECQLKHWPVHRMDRHPGLVDPQPPQDRPQQQQQQQQSFHRDEIHFYIVQLNHIMRPVLCCIMLSVLWVKLSQTSSYRPTGSSYSVYAQSSQDSTGQVLAGNFLNALIILGQIVVATVIFVVLFKFGCWRALYAYLFLTVVLLLGFMGWLLLLNLVQVMRIPMDWWTMAFGLWNFSVAGITVIFWRGPLWIQQFYLVIMSSLMAFALTGLQDWTTWMLLAILVIWDLVAVLCPYGPLRILVNESRAQNRDVPALLYSVTMLYYAPVPAWSALSASSWTMANRARDVTGQRQQFEMQPTDMDAGGPRSLSKAQPSTSSVPTDQGTPANQNQSNHCQERSGGEREQIPLGASNPGPAGPMDTEVGVEDDTTEDEEEESGLKLGLGDFVFYSVLVARTSLNDWITTVCSVVAILTGLTMTILLLAVFRKALPALPISIVFGLLFYFSAAYVLVPYVGWLSMTGVAL